MADLDPISSMICFTGKPSCEVKPIGLSTADDSTPVNKFSIRFQVSFTGSGGAAEPVIRRTFSEPLSALLPAAEEFCGSAEMADAAEGRARFKVANMLLAVRVPPLGPIVEKVLDGARQMARAAPNLLSQCPVVLVMGVEIVVSVARPRFMESNDLDYFCRTESEDDENDGDSMGDGDSDGDGDINIY